MFNKFLYCFGDKSFAQIDEITHIVIVFLLCYSEANVSQFSGTRDRPKNHAHRLSDSRQYACSLAERALIAIVPNLATGLRVLTNSSCCP
jgi:hypothetical protein